MKIVKSHSRPLDDTGDFQVIKALAGSQEWAEVDEVGKELNRSAEARKAYVDRVLSFVDVSALRPLKVVVNSGNGAAGPTFDALAERLMELGAPLEFIRVHHTPDATFPNGIPNPLLPENHPATANVVKAENADFGVAFDGDFDRCFFFDETGQFVPGEYVVGLRKEGNSTAITLSSEMLAVMGVKKGDAVYLTRSDDNGLKIHAHDPAVLESLAAAEVIMDENRTLLQELSLK
jgi:putative addiction module antidote